MTSVTRDTIIKSALFLSSISEEDYLNTTNKKRYDEIFDYLRRSLIANHRLDFTKREDVVLNTADEEGWYLEPSDLCQYGEGDQPCEVRINEYNNNNVLEKRTEIKPRRKNKITYFADIDYYTNFPPPMLEALRLKFMEAISMMRTPVNPQLGNYFYAKAQEKEAQIQDWKTWAESPVIYNYKSTPRGF
jgi:hypothetical protein